MNNSEIIKALLVNKIPYILLGKEMQDFLRSVPHKDVVYLQEEGVKPDQVVWDNPVKHKKINVKDKDFTFAVPRLRPDYIEKPEIVKCKIYPKGDILYYLDPFVQKERPISFAVDCLNFFGFRYTDETIGAVLRKYKKPGSDLLHFIDDYPSDYEAIAPFDVLFRDIK
jgi:hypothetical protein